MWGSQYLLDCYRLSRPSKQEKENHTSVFAFDGLVLFFISLIRYSYPSICILGHQSSVLAEHQWLQSLGESEARQEGLELSRGPEGRLDLTFQGSCWIRAVETFMTFLPDLSEKMVSRDRQRLGPGLLVGLGSQLLLPSTPQLHFHLMVISPNPNLNHNLDSPSLSPQMPRSICGLSSQSWLMSWSSWHLSISGGWIIFSAVWIMLLWKIISQTCSYHDAQPIFHGVLAPCSLEFWVRLFIVHIAWFVSHYTIIRIPASWVLGSMPVSGCWCHCLLTTNVL